MLWSIVSSRMLSSVRRLVPQVATYHPRCHNMHRSGFGNIFICTTNHRRTGERASDTLRRNDTAEPWCVNVASLVGCGPFQWGNRSRARIAVVGSVPTTNVLATTRQSIGRQTVLLVLVTLFDIQLVETLVTVFNDVILKLDTSTTTNHHACYGRPRITSNNMKSTKTQDWFTGMTHQSQFLHITGDEI